MNNPEEFQSQPQHASGMPTGTMPATDQTSTPPTGAIASGVETVKDATTQKIDQTVSAARLEAERAKMHASQKIDGIKGRARSRTEAIVDDKKRQIGGQLGMVSDALNRTSQKLHEDQHGSIAQYTDLAAEKVESLRQSIESRDLDGIIDDVQGFARRQPALVFGGLFVAGLATMRFLKSSSQRRTEMEIERRRQATASTDENYGQTLTPQQAAVVTNTDPYRPSLYNQKA